MKYWTFTAKLFLYLEISDILFINDESLEELDPSVLEKKKIIITESPIN